MRAARFHVSTELLRDVLQMPPASRIIGAHLDSSQRSVVFVVDDPSLPEAEQPHDVTPTVTRVTWDWNVR